MMTHGCHALGRCPLQQRLGPAQAGPLRRELQHERRAAAASNRAAADASEIERKGVVPFLDPLPRFEHRSRATSCGSSSAAADSARRSASRTRSKTPASPAPA